MSKANTRATINANIKQNGNQEITGQILNSVLNTMVDDYAEQEKLTDLESDIDTKIQKLPILVSKYAVQTQVWYGDDYTHIVIPVNGGEKVDYILTKGAFYCAFLTDYTTPIQNETPSFLTGYVGRQTYSGPSGNLTIPPGTKYFVINNPVGQGLSSVKINGLEIMNGVFPTIFALSNELQTLEGDVQTLKSNAIVEDDLSVVITSNNLANPNNVENGLINPSGEHVPLVGDPWNMLKVPVTPGQILTFGGFYLGRTAFYAFYNDNTLVSFAQFNDPNGTQKPVTVTIPDGANILYIDISTNLSPANPFQFMQVNIGSQLAEYDEFSERIESIKGIKVIGDGGSQDEIVDLIADLPVSDGTNIPVGYAYIDSASSVVKVKTA